MNGHLQTVGWHVDVFVITHVDQKVNKEFAAWFNAKNGKESPLTGHWGIQHNHLGM